MSKQQTAQTIIEHLRTLGPTARVLLIAQNRQILQRDSFEGKTGLLGQFQSEFSAVDPYVQLTHNLGGIVAVRTSEEAARDYGLENQTFSMTVMEGLPKIWGGKEELSRLRASRALRVGPRIAIESEKGEHNVE